MKEWKLELTRAAEKYLLWLKERNLDLFLKFKEIIFETIPENPFKYDLLSGEFAGTRSLHFKHKGGKYRVLFRIYKEQSRIAITWVGPRGKAYR